MRLTSAQSFMALMTACSLLACRPAQNEPHTDEPAAINTAAAQPDNARPAPLEAAPLDVRFQDVLNQYMGLNERLDRIASKLKISNADLCPAAEADISVTTHTLSDYPEELRPAARYYLNVGADMSIRTVRAGSPAAQAGLLAGDRITAVNGESLVEGPLFQDARLKGAMGKALFHTALNKMASGDTANILLRRHDRSFSAALPITRQCAVPVTLFFDESVNGHYIDGEIWITSGLLQEVSDDTRVAYILAHEMAHALRHETGERTPAIELDADRIGLILLARAGYEPSDLASFWAEQVYLWDGGNADNKSGGHHDSRSFAEAQSKSHPDIKRRADNFALTLSYIRAAGGDNEKLKALVKAP